MNGYRIKTVSTLTGVSRNTLLAWERRYGFVVPERTDNGYRIYSDADVAKLREVKALVDAGHPVSEAIALLEEHRRRGTLPPSMGPEEQDEQRDELLASLLAYDRTKADVVVAGFAGESFAELLENIYFPILRDLGDGWESGRYTIAQEHFASAYIRERLTRMLINLGCGPSGGPRVVMACYPDDPHELGLLGLSIRFALAGWRSVFLGARMPEADLIDFLQGHPAQLLCVSVVQQVERNALRGYAERVRHALPDAVGFAIGGAGVSPPVPIIPGVKFGVSFEQLMESLPPS
ncbi:MAG: MerR family transcriptional regulator [Myxococcota bacterium]